MSNQTVLIIEDNELNMKLVTTLLKMGRHNYLEANDSKTGIQMAREHLPDLILMDIQLPDMDGLSATQVLKKDPRTQHIPIIALTGYAMPEDETKAYDAGCDGYMSKPIEPKLFQSTIAQLLAGKETGKETPEKQVKDDLKPSILIVDDDPMNVKLLKTLLSPEYNTVIAGNGIIALDRVEEKLPDLILLDIMMPEMDGFTVTRKLKSDYRTQNIPIILITALSSESDKIKGIEAGADEFLNKPVNQTELKARVKSLLKMRIYQEQLSGRIHSGEKVIYPGSTRKTDGALEKMATILLVEDNRKDLDIFNIYLDKEPYRLLTVLDGQEALLKCQTEKVDLIILDLMIPGLGGFDVCRKLKKNENTRNIQILMVSSKSDLESRLKGIELGADDFLIKPVNKEELVIRIRSLIQKKSYMDHLINRFETALQAAITDRLTGLYNHSYLKHFMEHEIERCYRQEHPMALIMIDIDDFKKYNDTYGHPAGDTLLQLFGKIIKDTIREVDFAARYGGEEFAVILPYTGHKNARKAAERILENIRTGNAPGIKENKTASMGFACYPEDGMTMPDIIQRADEALYRAKKNGKNQICHLNPEF